MAIVKNVFCLAKESLAALMAAGVPVENAQPARLVTVQAAFLVSLNAIKKSVGLMVAVEPVESAMVPRSVRSMGNVGKQVAQVVSTRAAKTALAKNVPAIWILSVAR